MSREGRKKTLLERGEEDELSLGCSLRGVCHLSITDFDGSPTVTLKTVSSGI